MKTFFLLTLFFTLSFSDIFSMDSFEADFTQTVTDEKDNKLKYSGHIKVMKPQYALWSYLQPSTKLIYVNKNQATIVEPELEQVIIKNLHQSIDFFNIIKNSKKISENKYTTTFQAVKYTLYTKGSKLESIEYRDQLDNLIMINFTHQIVNKPMSVEEFEPNIPQNYDVIKG